MRHIRVAWVAAFLAVSGGVAHAELLVTESTVNGIAVNATFADAHAFDVPDGKKIRFLKRPENTTHKIDGPYQGTLAGYTSRCGWWEWLLGHCGPTRDIEAGSRDASVPGVTKSTIPMPED